VDDFLYTALPDDYYFAQYRARPSAPLLRLSNIWFRKRQDTTLALVRRHVPRGLVLDVGCGNSVWNPGEIRTVGLDIAQGMLRHNSRRIPAYASVCADFNLGLPFDDESFDGVIVTEVLEHVEPYPRLLREIHRVLKRGGTIIASVPNEQLPGLWGILFPLWCRYKVWRYHDRYYENGCGHCVSFGRKRLKEALRDFILVETRDLFRLTVFCVARKTAPRAC
jgi:ubiquinone/menaquinone biosynthesis C-methylase UbiE